MISEKSVLSSYSAGKKLASSGLLGCYQELVVNGDLQRIGAIRYPSRDTCWVFMVIIIKNDCTVIERHAINISSIQLHQTGYILLAWRYLFFVVFLQNAKQGKNNCGFKGLNVRNLGARLRKQKWIICKLLRTFKYYVQSCLGQLGMPLFYHCKLSASIILVISDQQVSIRCVLKREKLVFIFFLIDFCLCFQSLS